MDELCEGKLFQLSMDGLSVNVKFQVVQDGRKKKELQQTLVLGGCGLHTFMDLLKLL